MVFSTDADRAESHDRLRTHVNMGDADAALLGPTWAINGTRDALTRIEPKLGGELVISTAKPDPEPLIGDTCELEPNNESGLLRSSVRLDDGVLTATFEFVKAPDTSEFFGVVIEANNFSATSHSYMAGVEWIDGEHDGPWIYDNKTGKQRDDPTGDVSIDGKTVTVHFDGTLFEDLGDGWQWRSTVESPGDDVVCPESGEYLVFPS